MNNNKYFEGLHNNHFYYGSECSSTKNILRHLGRIRYEYSDQNIYAIIRKNIDIPKYERYRLSDFDAPKSDYMYSLFRELLKHYPEQLTYGKLKTRHSKSTQFFENCVRWWEINLAWGSTTCNIPITKFIWTNETVKALKKEVKKLSSTVETLQEYQETIENMENDAKTKKSDFLTKLSEMAKDLKLELESIPENDNTSYSNLFKDGMRENVYSKMRTIDSILSAYLGSGRTYFKGILPITTK